LNNFKAGLDRIKKGFQETHSAIDVGAGAAQSLLAPVAAAFQAVGGAGEKATGGILTGDQINTALMVADGAPGTFARVRNGAAQVIGALPTAEDFGNAAKVLSKESVVSAAVKFNDKIYTGANHLEALEKAAAEHGTDVENIHTKADDNKETQFDSWVTSDGRFVDSKEAAKIVNSPHEKLDSSDHEFLNQRETTEQNLRRMWQEEGIHPAEAVHDAQADAFLKHDLTAKQDPVTLDPETELVLTETGGKPGSLSAARSDAQRSRRHPARRAARPAARQPRCRVQGGGRQAYGHGSGCADADHADGDRHPRQHGDRQGLRQFAAPQPLGLVADR
jgi:hypothetical protein